MDKEIERIKVQIGVVQDQFLAQLSEKLPDIERILDNGVSHEDDFILLNKCLYFVQAAILQSKADAMSIDEDEHG